MIQKSVCCARAQGPPPVKQACVVVNHAHILSIARNKAGDGQTFELGDQLKVRNGLQLVPDAQLPLRVETSGEHRSHILIRTST